MSLSGIFDPMVKAYFANKYANAGGDAGGALDTGLCASTKNTLVLELEPSMLAGLEICELIDGMEYYKLSDDGSYADGTPDYTMVYFDAHNGEACRIWGMGTFNNSGDYGHTKGDISLNEVIFNFIREDGLLMIQQQYANTYDIFVLGTQRAVEFGAPSPGVYVWRDTSWFDGWAERLVLIESPME